MKHIIILLYCLALTACADMTSAQKQTAWIVGGIVVVGAVVASSSSSGGGPACKPTVGGSGDNFDFSCR